MTTASSRSVALLLPLWLLKLLLLGPGLVEVLLLWLLEPVLVLLHHSRSALLVCRQWPAVPVALCEISSGLDSPLVSQPAAKSAKRHQTSLRQRLPEHRPHLFGQCSISNWLVKANFLLQACFPGAYVGKKCSLNLFWITKLNVQNLIYFKLSSVRQNFSIFCFFYILIITYSNMCVDFVAYLDQSCVA